MTTTYNSLHYCRNETSGKLAIAINAFIDTDAHFTEPERDLLAAYLRMWAFYSGWQDNSGKLATLRENFDAMVTRGNRETIWQWLEQALEIGIDPL